LNVDRGTAKYYGNLALLNLIGLPVDFAYSIFLNAAVDGNTKAVAQEKKT
jgi:hypothetical protein